MGSGYQDAPAGTYPYLSMHWRPRTCMHCDKPDCRESCPDKAILKRRDGIVIIEKQRCTGCKLCLPACPYSAIIFDREKRTALKCDLCLSRLEKGLDPFCVRECVWGAIHFGDIGDPGSLVSVMMRESQGFILQPELGLDPAVHYLRAYD